MTTTNSSSTKKESVPNVQYPQNRLTSQPRTPDNPRITGPSLDDETPHSYVGPERKKPMAEPNIPTDDANGYKPNAGNPTAAPDTKPKLDRANRLAVDRPVRRLKNLQLDRVDLVNAGANQRAFVTLHKFEQDAATTLKSLISGEGDNVKDQVDTQPTEVAVDIQTGIDPDVAKGKPSGTNNRADVPADGFGVDDGVDTGAVGGKKKKMGGAQRGRAEEATSKSLEGEAPVRKTRTRVERVAKSEFDQIQKAHEQLAKANAELAERLEKMENERVESEFIAKARSLSNLGTASELGRLMHEASRVMKAESYQALERTFKAANAQLEKGELFATLGREDVDNPTVADRIADLAKAKLTAGTAATIEIAKMQVLHENPDLRDEYQAERGR